MDPFHTLHCSAESLQKSVSDGRSTAVKSSPLHHACREVATDTMYSLLDLSADPGARNDSGDTPLHYAPNGDVVAVLLRRRRVSVDVQNDAGRTPLHESIVLERLCVSQALVKAGADLTLRDEKGMSAFDYACLYENRAMVRVMLSGGRLNPAVADETNGLTPLHWAQGKVVVDMLVDAGADVHARDRAGRTPLHLGCSKSNVTVCALLSRGADVGALDGKQRTPLHFFSRVDRDNLVKFILERGAPVDARDASGETPLHHAARGGSPGVVGVLLRFGANPSWRSVTGRSALDLAVLDGNLGVVSELCRVTSINSAGLRGETSLHLASYAGNVAIVQMLLAAGADAAKSDHQRNSPLHCAVGKKHLGVVEVLIEHGVDVDAATRNGVTAVQNAARLGCYDVVAALVVAGAHLDRQNRMGSCALLVSVFRGFLSVAELLVGNGADVTVTDGADNTALHLARDSDAVNLLVDRGVSVEARNVLGDTPVMVLNKTLRGMIALVDRGAQINTRNRAGQTVLHKMGRYTQSAWVVDAADFLLRAGADETLCDNDGKRAIECFPAEGTVHAARTRRLLLSAPMDRAWRRRGLVLMCMTLGKASVPLDQAFEFGSLEALETVDMEVEISTEDWDDTVASVEFSSPSMEVDSFESFELQGRDWVRLVGWVFDKRSGMEGVFRKIVGYL